MLTFGMKGIQFLIGFFSFVSFSLPHLLVPLSPRSLSLDPPSSSRNPFLLNPSRPQNFLLAGYNIQHRRDLYPPTSMTSTNLNPICFCTDGTYIYAYALITTTDMGAYTNVLAKSNASPTSLSEITWTLESAVALGSLYYMFGNVLLGAIDCTVDSNGVFTILDASSKYSVSDETPTITRGLQYTPSTGKWTNINASSGYKWNFLTHAALFPVGGTWMQVFRTSDVDNSISVAIFDKTTNVFVEQNTTYALVNQRTAFLPFSLPSPTMHEKKKSKSKVDSKNEN